MGEHQVIILGGGLAGLTAGIQLAQKGVEVVILEKEDLPRHKVCGEYLSREVEAYLKELGADLKPLNPPVINRFALSGMRGQTIEASLEPGGWGLSRYAFDFHLYKRALEAGVTILKETATRVIYNNESFKVETFKGMELKAGVVLGGFGKRSRLDQSLERPFFKEKTRWMAIKSHYEHPDFPEDLVALHHFPQGYCGLSRTESGSVNLCYLTTVDAYKTGSGEGGFGSDLLAQNPLLELFLSRSRPLFKKPLGIAQVSFASKSPVVDHILMIGDAAGLLHPLCGNGMAMAIRSARLAAELTLERLEGRISGLQMERAYIRGWNRQFRNRIRTGRVLQGLLLKARATDMAIPVLQRVPMLLPKIISATHGTKMI